MKLLYEPCRSKLIDLKSAAARPIVYTAPIIGHPVDPENDPEMAVRAALQMQDVAREQAREQTRAGQFKEALELLALVRSHPSSYYESREKARKLWEELAAELPLELVTEAEARGRAMDLFETAETVVAEASAANQDPD